MPGAAASARRLLLQLAVALSGLVAVVEVLIAAGPLSSIYVAYLFPAAGALYVATGLLAWWRRPANRLGSLMTACGAMIVVSSFANTALPKLVAVGAITATLPLSMLIHLVHACPTGAVRGRVARVTVFAAYFAGLVLQVPIWAFTPEPPPFDVVLVSPRPHLAAVGADVQKYFGAVVIVVTLWLLGRRLRGYSATDRRLLAALLGFAVLAVLTVAVGGDVLPSLGLSVGASVDVQLAAVAIVPLGFLLVLLRGGFARPGELSSLVESVASSAGRGRELDAAVAATLGDSSAGVLRWSGTGYVDGDGRPASADPAGHRATMQVTVSGRPVGAVVYDDELGADPDALAAVTRVVGIALEREQLAAELSQSRTALQEASRRFLAAGDDTRRRVARDLHDGLQGSLVRLSLQARQAALDAPTSSGRWADLADGIDSAARELRALVNGVMPAPLVERGIAAAVRELADDLPLRAEITVSGVDYRLPAPVETTAYFVVAEALTNVVKHAGATLVHVRVCKDADRLKLEVADNGVGGAPGCGGSGLAGLRDRLSVLGGALEITSGGDGTVLRAEMPCA